MFMTTKRNRKNHIEEKTSASIMFSNNKKGIEKL